MPRIVLTDLAIRTLKPTGRQTQYWDRSLPCFGCRVNQTGTKTFNVMLGAERRLVKIGRYPKLDLASARRRAHELIDKEHDPLKISYPEARQLFFDRHLSTLKTTTAHEQIHLEKRTALTS